MNFSEAKHSFDEQYRKLSHLDRSLVTVDGKFIENISMKDVKNQPNEEYFKWQFIYSLIASNLIPRDYIGVEIYFPKGNKTSAPIKIDAVIFSDISWLNHYENYRKLKDQDSLNYLREIAIGVIEFKRNDKKIEEVFSSQVKSALKEPDSNFVLGIYYNMGRLYLFKRIGESITRYDNSKNFLKSQRILERFQLEITDPYYTIPSFNDLLRIKDKGATFKRSDIRVDDLDIVYTINDENIKSSLNQILRCMDSISLYNEAGYLILIQLLATKIFDEKQSEAHNTSLRFHLDDNEILTNDLSGVGIQKFLTRIQKLFSEAKITYPNLLYENKIDWKEIRHVRLVTEVVKQFQHYSFIRSKKSDLYQLVFYNFATKFKKDENAQFLTPLPIIDFLVKIVNPRRNEKVCDPCCGIADFLSFAYVNSQSKLDDKNLYGFDNDYNMTLLAQLNMLLNGDGNAVIKYVPDKGSINHKLAVSGEIRKLNLDYHAKGNWDNWTDRTELMKYDVILTNPPFGKGRSLDLSKNADKEVARLYELYELYVQENPKAGLDLGVVFLENAVRCLKEGGRFGLVLSGSIASNNTWTFVRKWLVDQIRLVASFDLPPNVFAETGVNTTVIIGYKPSQMSLKRLKADNYSIFVRDIKRVGYTKKTSNRNVIFEKNYLLDDETFETIINDQGESVLDEEFTDIVSDFREWCVFQEEELKKLFFD